MNINRLGIIKVSQEFILDGLLPEALYKANITPIQVERDIYSSLYIYKCLSNDFDVVKEGLKIPEYNIVFEKNEDTLNCEIIKCSL